MSLSTRAILGIGAVVLIGAGTVGGSIAYANSQGAPDQHLATLTVGRSSITAAPACYNDGKALDQALLTKCRQEAKQASEDKKTPRSDVVSSDRIGVGVPTSASDNGWFAFTDGGAQGEAVIAQDIKGSTYSGSIAASTLLNGSGTTTVTVVEANQQSNEVYAIWYFELNQKN
ncbi:MULTISPECIES: hypothetical protein [Kitasatospora]|uniref:DUF2771 domain-containing protein n=2 Tax=Kitasatospora TaxID=2063 RepID=A0ABT1IPP6_9ACTN|nr:hypothetical protein [Kitasatospora paracochleata]MCP2307097.1 hypothetical protein [Kitasatospora paracochleata]